MGLWDTGTWGHGATGPRSPRNQSLIDRSDLFCLPHIPDLLAERTMALDLQWGLGICIKASSGDTEWVLSATHRRLLTKLTQGLCDLLLLTEWARPEWACGVQFWGGSRKQMLNPPSIHPGPGRGLRALGQVSLFAETSPKHLLPVSCTSVPPQGAQPAGTLLLFSCFSSDCTGSCRQIPCS